LEQKACQFAGSVHASDAFSWSSRREKSGLHKPPSHLQSRDPVSDQDRPSVRRIFDSPFGLDDSVKLRILIVDDHPLMREGFSLLLKRVPEFEVVGTAVNGNEAIERVEEHHPDVVLMDVEMPVMNGISATQAVLTSHPELVVIGLTAHEASTTERQFLNAGAKGIFTKGSDTKVLIDRLLKLCGKDKVLH
jgi:CheY-like chemotaxis protein